MLHFSKFSDLDLQVLNVLGYDGQFKAINSTRKQHFAYAN